jgi:hypothetical protein
MHTMKNHEDNAAMNGTVGAAMTSLPVVGAAAPDDTLSSTAPAAANAAPTLQPRSATTGLRGTIKLKRLSAARYP